MGRTRQARKREREREREKERERKRDIERELLLPILREEIASLAAALGPLAWLT